MKKNIKNTARLVLACSALPSLILLNACVSEKGLGTASSIDALKIESAGSLSSGTVLPNLLAGGGTSAYASAPALKADDKTQIIYARSKRMSVLAELFGLSASNESVVYIGAPGESAEDTAKRLNAFEKKVE